MGFSGAFVSNVIQKTVIEFNENGSNQDTQSTSYEIDMEKENLQEIIIDHSFMFLIEDEISGTLMYAGKVINPKLL